MKVIGMDEKNQYIAIVTHTELEQCADKYYGKLDKLRIGSEFNLGAGYNFKADIKKACDEMASAMKAFEKAKESMLNFALMVGELDAKNEGVQP